MPAEPRPGVERHEAERLGACRLDHLPDVDAHGVEDHLELVDQGDVDGAEDVLGELDRLGHRRCADRHDAVHELAVERRCERRGGLPVTPDHLWNDARGKVDVARIFPLGRIGKKKILARSQSRALENRPHDFDRRARPRGRFEDHQLTRAQIGKDAFGRADHELEIGLAMACERRRHADHHDVDVADPGEVAARLETPARVELGDRRGVDMADVGAAVLQHRDLGGVDVEAKGMEAGLGHRLHQRQADVAEADDPDPGIAGEQTPLELRDHLGPLGAHRAPARPMAATAWSGALIRSSRRRSPASSDRRRK